MKTIQNLLDEYNIKLTTAQNKIDKINSKIKKINDLQKIIPDLYFEPRLIDLCYETHSGFCSKIKVKDFDSFEDSWKLINDFEDDDYLIYPFHKIQGTKIFNETLILKVFILDDNFPNTSKYKINNDIFLIKEIFTPTVYKKINLNIKNLIINHYKNGEIITNIDDFSEYKKIKDLISIS